MDVVACAFLPCVLRFTGFLADTRHKTIKYGKAWFFWKQSAAYCTAAVIVLLLCPGLPLPWMKTPFSSLPPPLFLVCVVMNITSNLQLTAERLTNTPF